MKAELLLDTVILQLIDEGKTATEITKLFEKQLAMYTAMPKPKPRSIPKISYAEFVTMTEDEYKKLVDLYGVTDVGKMIDVLDNYKGSTGKKYKSDYRTIRNWVVERVRGTEGADNNKAHKDRYAGYDFGF